MDFERWLEENRIEFDSIVGLLRKAFYGGMKQALTAKGMQFDPVPVTQEEMNMEYIKAIKAYRERTGCYLQVAIIAVRSAKGMEDGKKT